MTDEEKKTSLRVLIRALFFGGYLDKMPADDEGLRQALLKALLPIVGGPDGLWAARQLLNTAAKESAP